MAFQRVYRFLVWKTEYICITQLRSIDLPATRSLLLSSVPLLSCSFFILLLVNFRCLSSFSFVCSSKHFLFVSFFFIIYSLSPVFFFYLITYLFDLFSVDLFSSHRSYFRVRFLPSPLVTPSFGRFTPLFVSLILLFLSAFDLYPSFAFRRLSSILSFFGFYQRGIGVLVSTS